MLEPKTENVIKAWRKIHKKELLDPLRSSHKEYAAYTWEAKHTEL